MSPHVPDEAFPFRKSCRTLLALIFLYATVDLQISGVVRHRGKSGTALVTMSHLLLLLLSGDSASRSSGLLEEASPPHVLQHRVRVAL